MRAADGRAERLRELATELLGLNVEVILTGGREAIRAAREATTTQPIVFASTSDPVAEGFVESLVRPAGNTTGLTLEAGDEDAKRVELLRETVPGVSRPAILWSPRVAREFRRAEAAALSYGMEVVSLDLQNPDQLDMLFRSANNRSADALIVIADALFMPLAPQIVGFAAQDRLPAMYPTSTYAVAGGLMTYGASIPGNYRRAATYVDKILKGAKPGDLPVERPSKYDFIINLKAAHSIGLTMPRSTLVQATQIFE